MNRRVKKVITYLKRFLLSIVAFIVLYAIAALVLSVIPVNTEPDTGDIAIFINSNGVHTDIIVPLKNDVKDWTQDILYTHTKSQDSTMRYVAFGWGDKGFYLETPQWSDLKTSTALKAAFHLGTSAMHTRFYKYVQEDESCIKIKISKEDYALLVGYINNSFQFDDGKKVLWIKGHNYGDYDAFYEAKRKYNLFYTCNTWANNALKAANQKAALWTPSDKGILYHYR